MYSGNLGDGIAELCTFYVYPCEAPWDVEDGAGGTALPDAALVSVLVFLFAPVIGLGRRFGIWHGRHAVEHLITEDVN